jgi:ABC-type transport system involved in multi-copper enzyme maturation permease subunit
MIEQDKVVVSGRQEAFHKLLFENPMKMDAVRFRRRFIHVTKSTNVNRVLLGFTGLSYLMILGVVFSFRSDIQPPLVLLLQQFVVALVAIVSSHGAIAGERDRRSWELLLVAPVTQYQIVVGKFRGVLSFILGLQAVLLPAVLISQWFSPNSVGIGAIVGIEVLCLGSSSFCAALTIYLSSRLKSANATLVAAIASVLAIYAFLPLLASAFAQTVQGEMVVERLMSMYHPLWLIAATPFTHASVTFVVGFGYLIVTGAILWQTSRRLTHRRQTD